MADFSKSRICTLLGIRRPIFQGGMAWIATPELAAAVSEAGGLGILTSVWETVEQFRAHLRRLRQKTTRPFGVNLMLRHPGTAEIARIVAEERVPVVTTGAGDPQPYMASWLAADIRIIPVVSSVGYARLMERRGAAAVIAEGTEAGGHIGTTSTLCLVPQVVDAVKFRWWPLAVSEMGGEWPPRSCLERREYRWGPGFWRRGNATYIEGIRRSFCRRGTPARW